MYTSILTSKGQITIPAELRRLVNLCPGDALSFEVVGRQLIVSKRKDDITAAFGMCRTNKKVTLRDIQKATIKGYLQDNHETSK